MKGFTKIFLLGILVSVMFFSCASASLANDTEIVPSSGKSDGDYQLNDLVQVAVNIAKWILGISGSVALLAFVVGGFYFIMAGGNKDYIEKGKNSMIAAVFGLVIVFTAYTAIDYFFDKIGATNKANWNTTPTDNSSK